MKKIFGALLFSSLLLTGALALAGDTSTQASDCGAACTPCPACPGSCGPCGK